MLAKLELENMVKSSNKSNKPERDEEESKGG
jgi:hypothetical protein